MVAIIFQLGLTFCITKMKYFKYQAKGELKLRAKVLLLCKITMLKENKANMNERY